MVSKVVDYFSGKDKTPEFRKKALLCFLPKWKGFRLDGTPVKMDATEAVKSLFHVVGCLSNVWAEESGNRRKGNLTDFNVPMVICWLHSMAFISTRITFKVRYHIELFR